MTRPPDDHLDELIELAIVDACTDDEQFSGFQVMIDDNVAVPFDTAVLGLRVTVTAIDFVAGRHPRPAAARPAAGRCRMDPRVPRLGLVRA
ncbi:hypothetical protein [Nonomuraea sp. B1E8]|uniref:hypothetical protein n=1 Tax=unclassified Nonomuraea TaxID=2593643 RepID=UPI00325E1B8E